MDARQVTREQKARSPNGGFTFLEVMVAVMLLASAAGILIGLQGAAIRRGSRDLQAQQAMLAARRIMASIEAMDPKDFQLTSQGAQPVRELLNQLSVPPSENSIDETNLQQLFATLNVEDFVLPIPNTEDTPMKKLSLTVAWGHQRPEESFGIVYLISQTAEPPQ